VAGGQAGESVIPEAVGIETTTVEAELSVPTTGVMGEIAPELGAAVAPEAMVGTHVNAHLGRARK
jgi:hypothetical protein